MTVRFIHIRAADERRRIDSRGGATICYGFVADDVVAVSASWCSWQDNFCRKTGREVAASRLKESGPMDLVSIVNARNPAASIIEWAEVGLGYGPISIRRDKKGRFVSTFEEKRDG